ncbi:MAG TPA: cysteine--tRNA ligase [Nitrososphaerales archaeon]|nr:cysteine--tRNA ligase [Nitrososphaerales archaeon]
MQIFDTLSQSKVEIQNSNEFRMFVCGPTVQDNVHLGHAKTYLAFDILARWLLKRGTKVLFLLNITDVDDKIFDRAKRENMPYMQIADKFYNAFIEDLDALNVLTISRFERVSNYVEESAALVKQLLDSGKAYSRNGNVYFDTSKAIDFGKLSHQSAVSLKLKQIDAAPGKKNSVDFLLWRSVPEESEGVWQTVVGLGRPGWHIQDSAIAFSVLGGPYDLHGGATELIFPHHESELAQDEAISGEIPFVKIWMHSGLLLKGEEKMSKSLGNVVTIRQALEKFTADEIRFHFLKHHYRDSFEYDSKSMEQSRTEFKQITEAAANAPRKGGIVEETSTRKQWEEFAASMDDDLRTPQAVQVLLSVCEALKESENKSELGALFWDMVETLGFRLF